MIKIPIRENLMLAISEIHSGNADECQRIVDALLDTLSKVDPSSGAPGLIGCGLLWEIAIKAIKEGRV